MPTLCIDGSTHPWDKNPQLWLKCLKQASDAMIASGWNPKAKKFNKTKLNRARKLLNKLT